MKIGQIVRKLRIDDNSIILVKKDTDISKVVDEFVTAIHASGVSGVVVVIVDNFDDLKILREEEMNQVGWYKVDSLSRKILRAKANTQDKQDGQDDKDI